MEEFTNRLKFLKNKLPHASNLLHQIEEGKFNDRENNLTLNAIKNAYSRVLDQSVNTNEKLDVWVANQVLLTNQYINILKSPICQMFSHQSDFKSSVIPELVCIIFHQINIREGLSLDVEGQNEVTIDLLFSHTNQGQVFPKNKRVDAALLMSFPLATPGANRELEDFRIPLVAVEVKTNLDKNMISGIQHSVDKMKSTFPQCKYYVLSEFSDFNIAAQNYASSSIDEIYILRKQKRSEVRSGGIENLISEELILEFTMSVSQIASSINNSDLDVASRLESGLLVDKKRV
tara:strand:+ start:2165 stop:3034 length:870 start_codon:yes stop_codon:yes gene_type:complete